MRAAVFYGPGDLRVEERPRPRIAEDEVLLQVEACALCGSDARTYRYGASNITAPVVTGHEVAGTLAEVGSAVKGYAPGQRVAVAPAIPCGECRYCRRGAETMCDRLRSIGYEFDGGFAEYMAVPASAVRAGCVNIVPDGLSSTEAALAEPLACVINGQELLAVGPEDDVVVLGAGPVGCLHASLAKVRGARKVLMADLRPERLELARPFGADVFVDASRDDVRQRVLDETGGHGASVVIVAAPSRAAQELAVTLAAKRGRVDFFGGLPKSDPHMTLNANLVHYRELFIMGAYGSRPAHNRQALELLASGRIRVAGLVGLVLPLERVHEGIEAIAGGTVLKVVVKP
jgi:L-iditol 2-dehydrogenase